MEKKEHIYYIDNLRIFLITLVIFTHLAIVYGANGSWYWIDEASNPGILTKIVLTWFTGSNQSFFMGFFFMLSAFFIPSSYDRKGPGKFIKDRLMRLGLPLIFYVLIIHPITCYYISATKGIKNVSIFQFYGLPLGVGPLWFVVALLFFTFGYVFYRFIFNNINNPEMQTDKPFPNNYKVLLLIIIMTVGSFIIRIWLPIGWSSHVFGFQYPFFMQYICLFIIGIVMFREGWLKSVSDKHTRIWKYSTIILYLLGLPAMLLFAVKVYNCNFGPFLGGFRLSSLIFAVWYQLAGVSMIITLIVLFKKHLNNQGKITKAMSRSAFAVYIIHTPILVFYTLAMRNVNILPLYKFLILAPVVVITSFIVAYFITKIPYINKII